MDKTLRAGIFGIAVVVMVVFVAFGYSSLPFFPQGKSYEAFFADAGGISPGNDVNISGITVGKVSDVALAGEVAKVTFTVDRDIRLGDQTLVSIRTDTVLGERSLGVAPAGQRVGDLNSGGPHDSSVHPEHGPADLGQNAGAVDQEQLTQALGVLTDSFRDATPELRRTLDGVATLSRSINANDEALGQLLTRAKSVTGVLADRAGQVNQLVTDGNQLFAALDERRAALSNLIAGIDDVSEQLSGFVSDNRREFGPALRN